MILLAWAALAERVRPTDILTEQNGINGLIFGTGKAAAPVVPCTGANFRLTYNNTCSTVYYMTIH
jgi:hypothetical protein